MNYEILVETEKKDYAIPYPVVHVGYVGNLETARLIALYLRAHALRAGQFVIIRLANLMIVQNNDNELETIIENFEKKN